MKNINEDTKECHNHEAQPSGLLTEGDMRIYGCNAQESALM